MNLEQKVDGIEAEVMLMKGEIKQTLVDLRESPTPATDTETLLRQLAIYQLQLLEETPGSTS